MTHNIAKIRAALELARDYIASDLASERGAFSGYEGLSRIDEIKADIEGNAAALAALAELERAAAEHDAQLRDIAATKNTAKHKTAKPAASAKASKPKAATAKKSAATPAAAPRRRATRAATARVQ